MNMRLKLTTAIIGLMFSTSSFALDLEREQLLDLYHGVDSEAANPAQNEKEWTNLSAGIAPSYEEEFADIEFSPLHTEPKTQIGVFSGDLTEPELSENDYKPSTPAQFGQSEDERYGIYLKKRF